MSLTEPSGHCINCGTIEYEQTPIPLWRSYGTNVEILARIHKGRTAYGYCFDERIKGENKKEEVLLSLVPHRKGGGTMRMQDARDAVMWVSKLFSYLEARIFFSSLGLFNVVQQPALSRVHRLKGVKMKKLFSRLSSTRSFAKLFSIFVFAARARLPSRFF